MQTVLFWCDSRWIIPTTDFSLAISIWEKGWGWRRGRRLKTRGKRQKRRGRRQKRRGRRRKRRVFKKHEKTNMRRTQGRTRMRSLRGTAFNWYGFTTNDKWLSSIINTFRRACVLVCVFTIVNSHLISVSKCKHKHRYFFLPTEVKHHQINQGLFGVTSTTDLGWPWLTLPQVGVKVFKKVRKVTEHVGPLCHCYDRHEFMTGECVKWICHLQVLCANELTSKLLLTHLWGQTRPPRL